MENKKNLPLKVVHLAFMVLGLCFYVYTLINVKNATSTTSFLIIGIAQCSAAIFALISGFLYLTHGYKKDAVAYYKGYVWILLIKEIITTVAGNISSSYLIKFVWIIDLVLLTILTVGKDLGKTKSFTLVGLILVGKFILLINQFLSLKTSGLLGTAIVLDLIGQIILTITTGLMVCGKYLDKESRGAK